MENKALVSVLTLRPLRGWSFMVIQGEKIRQRLDATCMGLDS